MKKRVVCGYLPITIVISIAVVAIAIVAIAITIITPISWHESAVMVMMMEMHICSLSISFLLTNSFFFVFYEFFSDFAASIYILSISNCLTPFNVLRRFLMFNISELMTIVETIISFYYSY